MECKCAKCGTILILDKDYSTAQLLELGFDVWGVNDDGSYYITCKECTEEVAESVEKKYENKTQSYLNYYAPKIVYQEINV